MGLPEHFFDKTFIPLPDATAPELPNQRTRIIQLRDLVGAGRDLASLDGLYRNAVGQVYDYAHAIEAPGIAYALLGPQGDVRALQHVGDQRFKANSLVVGRHSHVDSPTEANNLALRHLVLTQRTNDPNMVEVRDLRSAAGTRLLDGTRMLAASLQAPVMLDLGELCLVVATTPVTTDREAFIDRVFHPNVTTLPLVSSPVGLRLERFRKTGERSRVLDDTALGLSIELRLEEMVELTPSPEQITRGFVIGRYNRCDWPAKSDPNASGLSRVHALVFASQGAPYIVDTGSTNGVRHTEMGCVRYKHLMLGDQFWLGSTCRLTVIEPRAQDAHLDA